MSTTATSTGSTLTVGLFAEPLPAGFGFSDTAFRIFILMASRRLKSDRFFTTDFTPKVYTPAGHAVAGRERHVERPEAPSPRSRRQLARRPERVRALEHGTRRLTSEVRSSKRRATFSCLSFMQGVCDARG